MKHQLYFSNTYLLVFMRNMFNKHNVLNKVLIFIIGSLLQTVSAFLSNRNNKH